MISTGYPRQQITAARIAGALSTAMGVFVLVGWMLEISWIKSLLPGAVEMKANTAVGLVLGGISLCLLDVETTIRRRWMGQTLASVLALLGLATLSEYVFGWHLGIDEFLFADKANAYNLIRGRMSPYSAVVFAVIGLGLMALPARSLRWFVWMAATLTLLIGGSSLIGYLWNASELVTDRFLPPVAINTALAFLLLGIGTLLATRSSMQEGADRAIPLSSVEKASLLGFLGTLILLLLAGGLTYQSAVISAEAAQMVAHTQQVRAALSHLYAAVSDAESQQRNYLLSGQPEYLAEYHRYALAVDKQEDVLARIVSDNPLQSQRLKELRAVVTDRMIAFRSTAATFEQSGLAAAQEIIRGGEGLKLQKTIQTSVAEMDAAEAELLTARETKASHDKARTLLSLLMTLAVAVAGFLTLFSRIRKEMTTRALAEIRVVRLNADLKVRAAELEEANKELETFSYSVSHDLRAPLRHVHGYVEMLSRESESHFSEKGRRYLSVISNASLQMGKLIDDLLAFSRMSRAEMRCVNINSRSLVEETIRSLEMDTQDRRFSWKIAELPDVMGDLALLRQVFSNLLGNAVKYTGQRDLAEIEVGCAGEEKGRTILFVRDNGAGFDMNYVHKLFGVFQRLHKAEEFPGTGIGLANVRRIITRHGGRTWAEGKVNEGATVYFTLQKASVA